MTDFRVVSISLTEYNELMQFRTAVETYLKVKETDVFSNNFDELREIIGTIGKAAKNGD